MNVFNDTMYDFTDVKRKEELDKDWLPSSAMWYDGILFEKSIEGYQTLFVEGREMLAPSLETTDVQNGSIVSNQRIPAREIVVHYQLEDTNAEELQFKFKELLRLLYRTEPVKIQFNDELDFTYFGRFSAVDNVPGDTNCIVSSFTIYCEDPWKYTRQFTSFGPITKLSYFGGIVESLEVEMTGSNSLKITNGRETIAITSAAINRNDVLVFTLKGIGNQEGTLTVNGENKTALLDITSDFSNFTIQKGDTIKANNGNLKIIYRGVSL